MMATIHPTAIIEDGATISATAQVGPYCVVGKHVALAEEVTLISHVTIGGRTQIGRGTTIYPFASLGHAPQDLKYQGEPSTLSIGEHNTIREHVTINPGTQGGGMVTKIGDHGLFMVGVHIGHDCEIGNHAIFANNATLAGHVAVGDHVLIGGLSAVHQFVRIGSHAVIGGMTGVEHDVIPYGSVMGERGHLAGLNLVGLKRRNVDRETIHALRNAFKIIFEHQEGTLTERTARAEEQYAAIPAVMEVIAFIRAESSRQLLVARG